MVAYDGGWWEFRTRAVIDDGLISQGDYDPDLDLNTGNFSIAMLVEELDTAYKYSNSHGLLGKQLTGIGKQGGYLVGYNGSGSDGKIQFKTGNYRDMWSVANIMAVGRKVLIVCTFERLAGQYVNNGKIITYDAVNGQLIASAANMYWPGSTSYNLYVGKTEMLTNAADAKMYWCGIYDGLLMSAQDVTDIWNETKDPILDFSPRLFNYFCQDVGSTYTADIGTGPNAPYVFDVVADPIQAGICEAEAVSVLGHEFTVGVATYSSLGHSFSVSLPTVDVLGHEFMITPRRKLIKSLPIRDKGILIGGR